MEAGERDASAAIEAVYRRHYGKFLRVAVAILRDELRRDMALCGQTSIKQLTPDCVFRVD